MCEINNRLEQIKKDIHTINPMISDTILDLLYEYLSCRLSYDIQISMMRNGLKGEHLVSSQSEMTSTVSPKEKTVNITGTYKDYGINQTYC